MIIRPIRQEDNQSIALVIRSILTEFGVNKPGTVFTDPTTDVLFELFQTKGSAYMVVQEGKEIVGGAGIFPTKGLPEGCVELVKIYLLPSLRNSGLGKKLMLICEELAVKLNYTSIYLETMPELDNAIGLYEHLGYKKLDGPLGDSGHHACTIWYEKSLIS